MVVTRERVFFSKTHSFFTKHQRKRLLETSVFGNVHRSSSQTSFSEHSLPENVEAQFLGFVTHRARKIRNAL